MALSIVAKNASFSEYVDRILPPSIPVEAFYLFGNTPEDSTANIGNAGKANSSLIGAPIIEQNYATISAADGFDSGLSYADDFTYFAVVRIGPSGTGAGICGWSAGSDYLHLYSSTLIRGAADGDGSNRLQLPFSDSNVFDFVAMTHTNGTDLTLYKISSSGVSSVSTTQALLDSSAVPFRVGAMGSVLGSGDVDIAACGLSSQGISEAEVQNLYEFLKIRMYNRGISLR